MRRWRVASSLILSITYHPPTQHVELELHDGSIVRHSHVSPALLAQWRQAESKGKFYLTQIRDRCPRELVRGPGGRQLRAA